MFRESIYIYVYHFVHTCQNSNSMISRTDAQAFDEINYPFKIWKVKKYTDVPIYLHSVPCSWGSAIFGWHWKDFLKFFQARTHIPFYNFTEELGDLGTGFQKKNIGNPALYLPSCRCNTWANSWKRFFIDYMFGRGLVMVFPNEASNKGFSTTHAAAGAHTSATAALKRNPRNTPVMCTLSCNFKYLILNDH